MSQKLIFFIAMLGFGSLGTSGLLFGCGEGGSSVDAIEDSSSSDADADSDANADNDAILSWDANTESDLAGYNVHYGTATGVYTEVIDVDLTSTPAVPKYTVADLEPGFTYFFAVTAYDYSGNESDYSAEKSKTIVVSSQK